MSLSDPIADMLTRIRNAVRINREQVDVKATKVCAGVAAVLQQEGYIEGFDKIEDGKQGFLRITLKYGQDGSPVIREIKRISKPGRRIYTPVAELPRVLGGFGISVVSTSKGILSDKKCREANVSGEVLCTVN